MTGLSPTATIVAAKEQVSCDLDDDAVILHLGNGTYYSLSGVGTRIWTLAQEPKRLSELRDIILREYDVEPERCWRDLERLVQELAAEHLVEVHDEALA